MSLRLSPFVVNCLAWVRLFRRKPEVAGCLSYLPSYFLYYVFELSQVCGRKPHLCSSISSFSLLVLRRSVFPSSFFCFKFVFC